MDGRHGVSCQHISGYISTRCSASDSPLCISATTETDTGPEDKCILNPDNKAHASYLHCEVLCTFLVRVSLINTNHECILKPHSGYIMGFKMRMRPM